MEISRLRASGLAMPAAVTRASRAAQAPAPSVFDAVVNGHPVLRQQVLRKRTLLALTQAVEDECCTRADRPLLFACFEQERYYRQSQERWQELARTAGSAVVFADFPDHSAPDAKPVLVALPESAPLRREWLLVCDDDSYPACVVAAERPGQSRTREMDRTFEAVWSVDAQVVRDAARVCAALADSLHPGVAVSMRDRLATTPPKASADLGRAHRLLERVVGYLDAV